MAELQPNDEFLVNRNDVTYTQPTETLMAKLENDDYLLINREDVTYKITGEDIYDSLVDPLELTVTLDITNPAPDETITAIASASGGKQPYTPITYQWKKRDQASNITDLAGETNSTFLVTADLAAFELACECMVEDSLGNSVTTLSAFTSPVTFKEEVDTPELLTPPDGAGMGLGINPESGFILSAETEGPTADMHGLRFDSVRKTFLNRGQADGNRRVYTVSFWYKPTNLSSNSRFLDAPGAPGGYPQTSFHLRADGTFRFNNSPDGTSFKNAITENAALILNKWHHIMLVVNLPGAEKCAIYVDGRKLTLTADTLADEDTYINTSALTLAIANTNNTSFLDGYLSDYFFVDGQALPPETFGKDFDGKWGPLDSSVVKANVLTQTSNITSITGDLIGLKVTKGGLYDVFPWAPQPQNLIDGNVSTQIFANDASANTGGATIEFNPPLEVPGGVLKIFAYYQSGNASIPNVFKVNGIDHEASINSRNDNSADVQLEDGVSLNFNELKSITIGRFTYCAGFSLDNTDTLFDAAPTVLSFADNTNLSEVTAGQTIEQEDLAVEGIVKSVDVSAKTISLLEASTTGLFSVGKKVNIGSFGANGFFLPFDPEAPGFNGQTWSNYAVNDGIEPWTKAFDGVVNPQFNLNEATSNTEFDPVVWEYTGSTPLTFNKLRIYARNDDASLTTGPDYQAKIFINDFEVTDQLVGNVPDWYEIDMTGASNSSSLEKIALTGYEGTVQGVMRLGAVEIDGYILIDDVSYSGVGDDASGNENNFHDENFELNEGGDYVITPENSLWSQENGFNGTPQSTVQANATDNAYFHVTTGIAVTLYPISPRSIKTISGVATGGPSRVTFQGGQADYGSNGTIWQINLGSAAEWSQANPITFQVVPPNSHSIWIGGIEIDDVLVDMVFAGLDTVTDTPVRNYAVLTGEAFTLNGALETNTNQKIYNSTVGIPSNSKIYWEVTIKKVRGLESNPIAGVHGIAPDGNRADQAGGAGFYLTSSANNGGIFVDGVKTDTDLVANSGDLIGLAFDYDTRVLQMYKNGVAWDSLTATNIDLSVVKVAEYMNLDGQSAINFGQQPFTASNVTHNQAAGTVEIDGVTYGTLNEPAVVKATLQLADAGTLDSIEGNPTMTAKVGGAKGTYESHTSNELVLTDVSGTWEVASEKAVSDVEYSIAAINPNDFVMTSSEFEATPSDVTHGASTWQVTKVDDYFYANPAIDVTSTTALESLTTGGLEEETVYRARVKHTSANGVDSLWSEQRHQNVFKTELLPVTVPNADMNGLRFDKTRNTDLCRTFPGFSVFTLSWWEKRTGDYDACMAINGSTMVAETSDNLLQVAVGGSARNFATSSVKNVWYHYVVTQSDTELRAYVNGVEVSAGNSSAIGSFPGGTYCLNGKSGYHDGGYKSDVYFVDGQALPPETFGALFPSDPDAVDRRWGPLDSAVVKSNIETKSPEFIAAFPDADYDSSQVWSDFLSPDGPWRNGNSKNQAFDGDESTSAALETQAATLTFSPNLGNGPFEVVYNGFNTGLTAVDIDGTTLAYSGNGTIWTGTVNTFNVMTMTANSGQRVGITSIKVDGKILVDAPSFGANGFYLPFDPAAASGPAPAYTVENFSLVDNVYALGDGNINTFTYSSKDGTTTYTFTPPITSSQAIRLRMKSGPSGCVGTDVYVNGTAYQGQWETTIGGNDKGNVEAWFTPSPDITTVESVSFRKIGDDTGYWTGISAIEYDGGTLFTGLPGGWSAIGVDDSGNENHFQDENFAVAGNTSQVWSSNTIGAVMKPWSNGFNGYLNPNADGNTGAAAGEETTIYFPDLPFTKLRIWGSATNSNFFKINGTGVTLDSNIATCVWTDVTSSVTSPLSSITLSESSGQGAGFGAIEVDGELLVDKNIQDTVTDTPMRNYAVLESGLNGNLEISDSSAVSTLTVSSGKYYFEVTSGTTITNVSTEGIDAGITTQSTAQGPNGNSYIYNFGDGRVYGPSGEITQFADSKEAGTIIGTTFDLDSETINWFKNGSLLGSTSISDYSGQPVRVTSGRAADYTINFGQQPFAASNATYDQAAGTVEIAGRYNTSEEWSNNIVGPPDPQKLVDGNLSTVSQSNSATITFDTPQVGLVEIFSEGQTGGDRYMIEANDTATFYTTTGLSGWVTLYTATALTSLKITRVLETNSTPNNEQRIAAYRINGKLLVDSSLWNTSEVWSSYNNLNTGTNSGTNRPITYMFDGNRATRYGKNQTGGQLGFTGWNIPGSTLTVEWNIGSLLNAWTLELNDNGSPLSQTNDSGGGDQINTYTIPGGTLTGFKFTHPGPDVQGLSVSRLLVDGVCLVDADTLSGGTFNTLYQTWDEYATFGAFFYNERTDEIIQAFTLKRRYGLLGAKPEAGIYDLSVQPNFAVAAYIKEDNVYVPIEDPAPRIAAAEAQAAAEVAAAQAEVRKYQRMLIRAACGWVVAKAYTAGDIIIYNGHVFRALEDNVATADNDPGDLDGTWEFLGLEEDAAPLAIDGYFPLYETEEVSNAAGNGSSHAHTFDGVTYYMPDGGVTIYHGDYTGFDY